MARDPERPNWRAALWLRRQRVRGRRRFIWAFVVSRLALPLTLLATLLRALTEPFQWGHLLAHVAVNLLGAGVVGGYVAGHLLWELIVARERVRDRRRPAPLKPRAAPGREPRRTRRPPPPGGAGPRP